MGKIGQIQLGKNGITDNFITTLKNHFKNHENVRVSVLKSACRDREELKQISDKIIDHLGDKFTAKTIGFTIKIKRWRKSQR